MLGRFSQIKYSLNSNFLSVNFPDLFKYGKEKRQYQIFLQRGKYLLVGLEVNTIPTAIWVDKDQALYQKGSKSGWKDWRVAANNYWHLVHIPEFELSRPFKALREEERARWSEEVTLGTDNVRGRSKDRTADLKF